MTSNLLSRYCLRSNQELQTDYLEDLLKELNNLVEKKIVKKFSILPIIICIMLTIVLLVNVAAIITLAKIHLEKIDYSA